MTVQNLVLYGLTLLYIIMNQMWGESIFATDLNGVESVVMAGIILMLQLCVESWGIQQMVSLHQHSHSRQIILLLSKSSPYASGAQAMYYSSNINDPIIAIENVNCSWDELRLRDCPYSISHSCPSG